jgi:hypothetical protein
VGHGEARTAPGSGRIAPATVARAAFALGTAEIGRVLPPRPEPATEARPLTAPLAGAAGEAHTAPEAGGGGIS